MTTSVGTTASPTSFATRTTSTIREIIAPSTRSRSGRKSCVSANSRTVSKPMSAM
jgi:hypothetical protein